jgi:superfamily I DNA and RNA helicase
VIDKFGRVVQIEAIGIQNARVKTRKGIAFGDTFAEVIKAYRVPDGYEIAGDNVMVKFLTRSKVAFRLSRLGPEKPQVVTGIVVAAGKG